MDIVEVAKQSGVPASTLRYYEERGLIRSVGRTGLRRVFPAAVLERLALIALARESGFSLDEIGRMFTTEASPRINRQLLTDKAEELDSRIRQLTRMRDGLKHAAACPAPSHMECPKFRRLMGLAVARTVSGHRAKPASKLSRKRKKVSSI